MRHNYIVVCIILLATACGPPTIDSSSTEAFQASIEEIKNTLPNDQQKQLFVKAVKTFTTPSGAAAFAAGLATLAGEQGKTMADSLLGKFRLRLRGMSASQVFSEWHDSLTVELENIKKMKAEADAAKEALAKFEINSARFYFQKSMFSAQPIIELRVKNATDYAISRAYFHGKVHTPGRQVPWVEDDFNYQIRGGLESGESATWNLSPNMFSDWGKAPQDRKDMEFEVRLVKIDGPDGETLFDSEFTEDYANRMTELEQDLAQIPYLE